MTNLVCGLVVRDLDYFNFYLRKPITIEKNHYFSLFLNVSEVRINDFWEKWILPHCGTREARLRGRLSSQLSRLRVWVCPWHSFHWNMFLRNGCGGLISVLSLLIPDLTDRTWLTMTPSLVSWKLPTIHCWIIRVFAVGAAPPPLHLWCRTTFLFTRYLWRGQDFPLKNSNNSSL